MTVLATSTFLQVVFASLIIVPMMILWVAAVVDALRSGASGWRVAGVLLLILVLPFVGPLLYFALRKPHDVSAEAMHMADLDRHREAARRPGGGVGM